MKIINTKLINEIIGYEPNINVGVTSEKLKDIVSSEDRNVDVLDEDLNAKRFYHFIVCDTKRDIKPLFRALRNGGYLISTIDLDDNELYDIGFSALNRIDGLLVVKKVHSWNDW
ncbi:hypothetical protein [Caminibacter pacificus]